MNTDFNYFSIPPPVNYEEGGCPPDWYKLDKNCYTLAGTSNPMTWNEAQQHCMDNSAGDGNLATIYAAGLQCKNVMKLLCFLYSIFS